MPWEPPDLDPDEDATTDAIFEGMETAMPGWEPIDGSPETALAEEIGRETALQKQLLVLFTELAVAGIGETVFNFPAYQGDTATIAVDLTVTGAGAVIPAGFTVVGLTADENEVAFEVPTEVIAAGAVVPVVMTAAVAGAVGNDVPAGELVIVTATATVITAVATSPSAGGADPEAIEDYLDRLVDRLSVLRPGGVLGADMAALARTVPGVARALGVDNYDLPSGNAAAEKTVTVYVIDETGAAVDAGIKADVHDVLEATREPGFVIYVGDPTYTAVDVDYDVVADPGTDHAQVADAIAAAVLAFLSPATWGTTATDDTAWQPINVVRLFDVAGVIGNVPGVSSVTTVTLNGATADVNLPGRAPLPAAGSTMTGTVS